MTDIETIKTGFNFMEFILNWKTIVTIIFIVFSLGIATYKTLSESNVKYIIVDGIGTFISPDEKLYWDIKDVENNNWQLSSSFIKTTDEGLFKDIKSVIIKIIFVFKILSTIGLIIVFCYAIYWMLDKMYNGSPFVNILIAIAIIFLLQALYGVSLLYLNTSNDIPDIDKEINLSIALIPFKGIGYTAYRFYTGELWQITLLKEATAPIIVSQQNTTLAN